MKKANISAELGTVKHRSGSKTGIEFLVEYRKDGAHFLLEGYFRHLAVEKWFEGIIEQELRYLGWGYYGAKIIAPHANSLLYQAMSLLSHDHQSGGRLQV